MSVSTKLENNRLLVGCFLLPTSWVALFIPDPYQFALAMGLFVIMLCITVINLNRLDKTKGPMSPLGTADKLLLFASMTTLAGIAWYRWGLDGGREIMPSLFAIMAINSLPKGQMIEANSK